MTQAVLSHPGGFLGVQDAMPLSSAAFSVSTFAFGSFHLVLSAFCAPGRVLALGGTGNADPISSHEAHWE